MKKTTEPSTRIGDEELRDSLIVKATKTAFKDEQRLKKEADLHRGVLANLRQVATAAGRAPQRHIARRGRPCTMIFR